MLTDRMAQAGWPEPLVLTTTADDPGGRQAREAVRFGADLVVVAGGDGTLRHVAHELVQPGVVERGIRLGVVPLGTANLFALNAGLYPASLEQSVATVVGLRDHRFDVWQAGLTFRDSGGEVTRADTFLVVCGIGRDARTVAKVPEGIKHTMGWVSYLTPAVVTMMAHRVGMRVQLDDNEPLDVRAWSVLAVNLGMLPAGIEMSTSAGDDGVLEVLVVAPDKPWHWVGIAARGLWHLHRRIPGLVQSSARRIRVVPERPQPVQLDGDVIEGVRRLDVRVRERALRVLVPGADSPR